MSGDGKDKSIAVDPVEDLWAQCDNPSCKKWRRLPVGSSIEDDNAPWFCWMNPDTTRNTCSASEESYHEEDYVDADLMTTEVTSASEPKATKKSSKSQQKSKKESGSKKRKKSPREDLVKNRRAGAKDSSKHGKGVYWQEQIPIDRQTVVLELKTRAKNMFRIVQGQNHPPLSRRDWELLGIHSPGSAELACKTADWASAAEYFKKGNGRGGFYYSAMTAYESALKFCAILASLNVVKSLRTAGERPTARAEGTSDQGGLRRHGHSGEGVGDNPDDGASMSLDDALVIRGDKGFFSGA